jgi:cyd operon protein YbgT
LHQSAFFFMIAAKCRAVGAARCGFTLGSAACYLCLPASLLLCTGHAQCFTVCLAGPTFKETAMWYFTWILGIGVALGFGIINVMWLEASGKFARDPQIAGTPPTAPEDTPS